MIRSIPACLGWDKTYCYDAAGNPTQQVDFDGRSSSTTYDGDSRAVQSVDITGTTTITTASSYDPDGNVISQTTRTVDSSSPGSVQTHTTSATYNAADWQTSHTDDGLSTAYSYDAAGQLRTQSGAGGNAVWALDPQGRASSISEASGANATSFGYTPNDLVSSALMPGGVSQSATYDGASRVKHVGASGPSTGVLTTTLTSSYDYGYSAVGWTTAVTATVLGVQSTQLITHNALGRVSAQSGGQDAPAGGTEQWAYDASGNITQTLEPMEGSTQKGRSSASRPSR